MKKTIKIIAFFLCLVICVPLFTSCEAKTLITYEDKTLSVNVYEFLLSRMKGTLAYYGYEVDKSSFWKTVVSLEDGTTYNDYFRATIMQQAVYYVIADRMFDENNLTLTDEHEKRIDDLMSAYVKKAGSKSKLNEELKEYGVNYEILREVLVLEAKIELLKDHLYGKSGERIDTAIKEEYFKENYVAFKQIFIATYEYVPYKEAGEIVYFTDDTYKAIAYDKVNGETQINEFGSTVKDSFGNEVYYTSEGKVAYDKVNGVIRYMTNSDGDKIIEELSEDKKSELYLNAKEYASACNGNIVLFDEYAEKYGESEENDLVYLYASSGYYAAQGDSFAYFDDMAKLLLTLDIGECSVFTSAYGYHVLVRCENESGAYADEKNKDTFTDFNDSLVTLLFESECSEREKSVKIDDSVFEEAPDMIDVGINTLY